MKSALLEAINASCLFQALPDLAAADGQVYDLAFSLNGRGNYSSFWIKVILGTEMLNKWRAWRKPAQEENWGLLGEELEMEGLAEGSCRAEGELGDAGGEAVRLGGRAVARSGPPVPAKGSAREIPAPSSPGAAPVASGLALHSDSGIARQKKP